jgi:mRNA interferase MazF
MPSYSRNDVVLGDWRSVGLNVETAVKRGLYTVRQDLVALKIGALSEIDVVQLERSLRGWMGL